MQTTPVLHCLVRPCTISLFAAAAAGATHPSRQTMLFLFLTVSVALNCSNRVLKALHSRPQTMSSLSKWRNQRKTDTEFVIIRRFALLS